MVGEHVEHVLRLGCRFVSDNVKTRLRDIMLEDPSRVHVLLQRLDSYLTV
jgi:hypothetical protein